jgi:phage virion morphogenesis protein
MLKITWNAGDLIVPLKKLRVSLGDRAALHRVMGEVLLRNTQRRFRREVRPDGAKWAKLSPVTLAARRNKKGILRDSGELFGSIHMQADARRAEVGTSLRHPKVLTHQYGAVIRPKRAKALRIPGGAPGSGRKTKGKKGRRDLFIRKAVIPARPYLGIGLEDAGDVIEAINGWLERHTR